jgi:membrane-associated phospholipid phosphatase
MANVPSDSAVWRPVRPAHQALAWPTLTLAGSGALVGAAGISLLDNHLAHETQKFRAWSGSRMEHASVLTSAIGGTGPIALGATLFAAGALAGNGNMRGMGRDVTQSVLASGVITLALKGVIGRARPLRAPEDPDQYKPGRGFLTSSLASFPSGHTSAAFAAATVLSTELSRLHPSKRRWFMAAGYGAATLVGLSRMYVNAHWASDVVAGAALGTLSGMRIAIRSPIGR